MSTNRSADPRSLLDRAVDAMATLHRAIEPMEDDPELAGRVPPAAMRAFVDALADIDRERCATKRTEPPYRVRGFWSPCRKYIASACVSENDITVIDDDGRIWEPAGPEQDMSKSPPEPKAILTSNQCAYCGYEDGQHNAVCVAAENARLRDALLDLYNGTAEYVYLNNLGDPHNTTPMRRAAEVLGVAYPRSLGAKNLPRPAAETPASLTHQPGRCKSICIGQCTELAGHEGECRVPLYVEWRGAPKTNDHCEHGLPRRFCTAVHEPLMVTCYECERCKVFTPITLTKCSGCGGEWKPSHE